MTFTIAFINVPSRKKQNKKKNISGVHLETKQWPQYISDSLAFT